MSGRPPSQGAPAAPPPSLGARLTERVALPARRLAALRSARALLAGAALLLLGVPLLSLGAATGYEALLLRGVRRDLLRVAAAADSDESALRGRPGLPAALAYVLDADGTARGPLGEPDRALGAALFGEGAAPPEALLALERARGPLAGRPEVARARRGALAFETSVSPSGDAVVAHLAVPRPGGAVLSLSRGALRGPRRILLVRGELFALALSQALFALLLGALLGRRLLLPLDRLARAARRYPREPLGDGELLGRGDEIGELARAMRALADDLEARRRQTADLGADVAHEFKNPLATIAASAELLAGGDAAPERQRMLAEHVSEATLRLRRSLDALLSLLRLEAALRSEPRERTDYGALLEEILEDYRRDPRWARWSLRLERGGDLGAVLLVPQRWEELLRNLIDNALVQPAERRELVVSARREAGLLLTTVRDFGPGVSPGNRDKIFRRFFSQRPAGAPPGTGLGLPIAQAVAEAHGGRIEVREPPQGPGALFVVTLAGEDGI